MPPKKIKGFKLSDYGIPKDQVPKQATVVLMTDKELLEILDILKDLCQADPFVMKKVEAMEKKFKTNK